jgi:hypothetical protein
MDALPRAASRPCRSGPVRRPWAGRRAATSSLARDLACPGAPPARPGSRSHPDGRRIVARLTGRGGRAKTLAAHGGGEYAQPPLKTLLTR